MAEFQVGDEVVYKNFPSRMTVEWIDQDEIETYEYQALCHWIRDGKPNGFHCRDHFKLADLNKLLPPPEHPFDDLFLRPGMKVQDSRIERKIDMEVKRVIWNYGFVGNHRAYCTWQDGGIGFGYWFKTNELEIVSE